jgi:hypothetical protein
MPRIPSAKKAQSEPPSGPRKLPGADVFDVVPYDAKPIVTIEEDSRLWTMEILTGFGHGFAGSFVRLKPLKGTAEERIRAVEDALRKAGVAAVKVLRAREDGTVVEPKQETLVSWTARGMVLRMAEECRTRDRAALVRVLEAALDKEGL